MIPHLILKELRDHVLSLRFQAGFLLAFVLISASAFMLSTGYVRAQKDFVQRTRMEDDAVRQYGHLNRLGAFFSYSRPPAPLVLVRGIPDEMTVETLDANPTQDLFPPMDLASVVAVVFSLLGILLGFDAINGERERGTLRLILANRVRRFDLLTAKWIGGTLMLAVALVAALLAGAAIVLVRTEGAWSPDDWLAFLWLGVVSLAYATVFFTLALAFSALVRRSSLSVVLSVFAWVLLVLVIPNVSPYVAAQFVRLSSRAALERDYQYITSEERDEVLRAEMRKLVQKYNTGNSWVELFGDKTSSQVQARVKEDPAFRQMYQQLAAERLSTVEEVNRKQSAKAERLTDAWEARAREQFELARRLSYLSPLPPYVYASTALAATGFESRKSYSRQVSAVAKAVWDFAEARFVEERRKNPAFGYNDYLDVSRRPRFHYVPPPFSDRLGDALPFARLLAFWVVGLFAVAVGGFLRFDVR